ncbi:MAG: hypothetical protein JSS40_14290 [Proteobacteria bacterium]|nr:hypothetical protein [Pseudomonadota bacterium]
MSSNYPIAVVDFEEAKTLADLEGLKQDLLAVAETCTRLAELLKIDSKDHILVEALWTSALIRYARCFAEGKRYGLKESVFDGLNGDPVGTHKIFIDIRSKHIAHSVNPLEQTHVGLVLEQPERAKKVIGVAALAFRQIAGDIRLVPQLGALANVLAEKMAMLAKKYEEKVLEIGAELPIEELYARANAGLSGTEIGALGKPRK